MEIQTDDPQKEREARLKQSILSDIQALENSDGCRSFFDQMQSLAMTARFLEKIKLGSENQLKMVIYGIGSLEDDIGPRYQLGLAILIKKRHEWIGEIEVFDPVISQTEYRVMTSLGCTVLKKNEECRRAAVKPTVFMMPHCPLNLYENLLQANWRSVDQLNNILLLGNSFRSYEGFLDKTILTHMSAASSFTEEFELAMPPKPTSWSSPSGSDEDPLGRALYLMSWHFFNPPTDVNLHRLLSKAQKAARIRVTILDGFRNFHVFYIIVKLLYLLYFCYCNYMA